MDITVNVNDSYHVLQMKWKFSAMLVVYRKELLYASAESKAIFLRNSWRSILIPLFDAWPLMMMPTSNFLYPKILILNLLMLWYV